MDILLDTIHRDPIALNSNGSIPSVGICTPTVKVSNKVSEVVGSVSGPGLGAPSTSSMMGGSVISSPSIALPSVQHQHLNLRHGGVGGSVGSGGGSGSCVTVTKKCSSANSKSSSNSSPSVGGGVQVHHAQLQHAQVYPSNCSNDTQPGVHVHQYGAGAGGGLSHKSSSHLGKAINHHVISGNLVFEDGHLVSGTLEGLVDYLVPSEDHFPDKAFLFAFILSSRIYIRPHQLLATVLHRAFLNKSEEESSLITIVSNLVRLLREWTQIFPYDFRDDNGLMMANVRAITHKCVHICPSMKKEVGILLTSLLDRLTLLEKFESNIAKINLEVQMASNHGMEEGSQILKLCPDPRIIAEQLALVELERFSFIGIQEFIQAFIKEPYSPPSNSTTTSNSNTTADSPSPVVNSNGGGAGNGNKSKKSRLESYVEWFHRLSLCVSTDICKMSLRKKDRVRVLEFWSAVGSASVTLGNFNSAIAIFTAINSNPVRRLLKTWSKFTGQEHLHSLESCFDPTNNFASYRSRLKGGASGGGGGPEEISGSMSTSTAWTSVVVVPFFSLLIRDLFFLKEACASRLPNGHLAFSNFLQLGSNLGEVMRWQQQKPEDTRTLNKVAHLLHVIQTLPALNESALMLASFECESPSSPEEKELLDSISRVIPPPPPPPMEDEELTDSFQSLPLPSTSSGSTSGVHEDDSVGISPTEIHKLLQFKFAQNNPTFYACPIPDIFSSANNTLIGLGGGGGGNGMGVVGSSEAQIHMPPTQNYNNGTTTTADTGTIKHKQKPPVPL